MTPGDAADLSFDVQPSDTLFSTPTDIHFITPAVRVLLTDAQANPVPGVDVSIAIGDNPGFGTLSGDTTVQTDTNGSRRSRI